MDGTKQLTAEDVEEIAREGKINALNAKASSLLMEAGRMRYDTAGSPTKAYVDSRKALGSVRDLLADAEMILAAREGA